MTNEQAKHKAIKKAYGDSWDLVKEFCDEEGWITDKWVAHGLSVGISYEDAGFNSDQILIKQYNSSDNSWRLRTIYSILTNNGWTRIEPDGSNLPTDEFQKYKLLFENEKIVYYGYYDPRNKMWYNDDLDAKQFYTATVVNYKPIEKELLPIY